MLQNMANIRNNTTEERKQVDETSTSFLFLHKLQLILCDSRQQQEIFSLFQKRPDWLWGQLSLLPKGHRFYHGWKLAEAFSSPPIRAEVKNEWSYTCTPRIRHRAVHRDSFIPSYLRNKEGDYKPWELGVADWANFHFWLPKTLSCTKRLRIMGKQE